MIVVGITGTIGSGKSTTSSILNCMGYDVFDADFCIKELINKPKYIKKILENFGAKISNLYQGERINTKLLGDHVFSDSNELKKLEKILHPGVFEKKVTFILKKALSRKKIIFLDIPLLYESDSYLHCDYILNMKVNKKVQDYRVMKRKNMNKQKYDFILRKQSINIKFNINKIINLNSGIGKFFVRKQIRSFLTKINRTKRNFLWSKMNSRSFYAKNSFRYRDNRS